MNMQNTCDVRFGTRRRTRSRLALLFIVLLLNGALSGNTAPQAAESPAPGYQEIIRILRANLKGIDEDELNRAVVDGLLQHFHPRVLLITNATPKLETKADSLLRRVVVYEGSVAYVGVRQVENGVAAAITTALDAVQSSNRVEGLVLDLRAAQGDGYRAAAEVADRFATRQGVLLRWDDVEISTSQLDRRGEPIVVLVNSETAGAAEALAAALRSSGPAVLLGQQTAGHAYAMRSFPIDDRVELRIASAPVLVGGAESLVSGVRPDLETASPPDQERVWLDDPYRDLGGTNIALAGRPRPRLDEAELVRRHEGLTNRAGDARIEARSPAPETALRDPALVRALDVLKGVMRVRGNSERAR